MRRFASLLVLASLAGCNKIPVTPWVNFTPYANPLFDHTDFENVLAAWKSGKAVTWEIRFKGTGLSDQELVIKSTGEGNLGPRLPSGSSTTRTFKATNAQLIAVVDSITDSGVLSLYDGHYGAYSQGGGAGGPELTITIGTLVKHVSKDESLSPSISREASSIQKASDAVADLALKYIK
ncbi:MAG: hypothetical protein JWM80_3881 [Cyanobacteria bacterium RYN_339]|nr:hypothetical protein [Cyanobacteria bacterium RYN_339]